MGDNCVRCGSYAINPGHYGRTENDDLNLCDVCYWRARAEKLRDYLVDETKLIKVRLIDGRAYVDLEDVILAIKRRI
jgi:hypothetical protein